MFAGIPQERLILYLSIFCLIPMVFVVFSLNQQNTLLADYELEVEEVHHLARMQNQREAVNRRVEAYFQDADHFYIDKNLESLIFLEPEIEFLQENIKTSVVAPDPSVKSRLDFLTGPNNSLSFSEGAVQSFAGVQEVTETLVHPVELNTQDLQQLLARVEGKQVGPFEPAPSRPLLLVLDFKLEKKKVSGEHEVYSLFMRLLKREFL